MHIHKQPFSSAGKNVFQKTKNWRETVQDEQIYKIYVAIDY